MTVDQRRNRVDQNGRGVGEHAAPIAGVMTAVAQVDVEMDADAATAAQEQRRTIGGQTRPVGGHEQIGLERIAIEIADLAEIGRADSRLDEFGIEAELAAAGLAHGTERRHVDAVLALVVSGAAAIEANARRCRAPGIAAIAPLALHAVDDVAIDHGVRHGRRRRALVMLHEQEGRLATRGFDQTAGKIERGEGRHHLLFQIAT